MGYTLNRPHKGRSKMLSPCAVHQVQTHECCQHWFRGWRSGRSACQCSDLTPHTALIPEECLHLQKEGGSQKKPENSLLKKTWPKA